MKDWTGGRQKAPHMKGTGILRLFPIPPTFQEPPNPVPVAYFRSPCRSMAKGEQLCLSTQPPTSKVGLRTSGSLACDPHWKSVSILKLPGKLRQQSSQYTEKTFPFVPSSVWRHHVTRNEGPAMKLSAGFLLLWQNI